MAGRTDERFDAAYYRRFYRVAATRATTRQAAVRRARLVAGAAAQLGLPVRRILDAGCGLGWFREPFLAAFPRSTYTGLEFSRYLCDRHGWQQGSVTDYRGRGRFDLVTCSDVLQYLDDAEATRALANLTRLCRGLLYLHVPTREDFRLRIDPSGTDLEVHRRSGDWYRTRLARRFTPLGFGLHLRKPRAADQWELEQAGSNA